MTDVSFDLPIMGQINFTQVYATSDTHAHMVHVSRARTTHAAARRSRGYGDCRLLDRHGAGVVVFATQAQRAKCSLTLVGAPSCLENLFSLYPVF